MDKQDSLWIGLTELPPCLGVLEKGPEGPAIRLGQTIPSSSQELVEPCRNAVSYCFLVPGHRRSDSSWGLVEALIPFIVALLVVIHDGHKGVQTVTADVDVLALRVDVGLQSIDRKVRLEESTVFLRLDDRFQNLGRGDAKVDPRRERAYGARLLLSIEDQFGHDALHPSCATLPPSSDDDIIGAVIDYLPLRGVEMMAVILVADRHVGAILGRGVVGLDVG
mmetsp:Transcript_33388/g.72185  ORF Transcript_33388/g.72185 Transcript_33388/m.72185 type:complete len:222 (+) Transcript_33388:542-1207(+)